MTFKKQQREVILRLRLRVAARRWVMALALLGAAVPVSGGSTGADISVHELTGAIHYDPEGDTHAFSVGTIACSKGTEPVNWCDEASGCLPGATDTDYPVIGQNLYRLKDGRFEQIGMSWLKHGFAAVAPQGQNTGCGDGVCDQPISDRDYLGVGCTDTYSATRNGLRPLGPRSSVNPATGEHPSRPDSSSGTGIDERLQVVEFDIDPTMNPGARYWVEGHYLAPDDAEDGNALNNTSYREVVFLPGTLDLNLAGSTQRQAAAIEAWQTADALVELVSVDLPAHNPPERFHAARRVSGQIGDWHSEYAIHNLNSDRGARSLEIRFPGPVSITNAGFSGVDHHSGEPYATDDWIIEVDGTAGTIKWSTDTFAVEPDANALRWGTMFSFWFDSDEPLAGVTHTLELFNPGAPGQVDQIAIAFPDAPVIFSDDFQSQDVSGWTDSQP